MSDPLRYDPGLEQGITDAEAVMFQCPDGTFVKYADYARLNAEVERLRKELADAQENYHIVNEMVAKMLKEGKQS